MNELNLRPFIRAIPDFPKKGILFYDITPLLSNPNALQFSIQQMQTQIANDPPECIVGIESRGFIFGALLAQQLNVPFIPVRKKGKLPHKTIEHSYELEYGQATLEIHEDALQPKQRVLVVDDVLATGGTARATAFLVEKLDAKITGFCFLAELTFLNGRKNLNGYPVHALLQFDN